MRSLIKNKKGDFASVIIMIVVVFALAIGAVLSGHVLVTVLGEFKEQPEIKDTFAGETAEMVQEKSIGYLDFFVFFLLFAMIIGIIVSATMIDTNPAIMVVFIVGLFIIVFLAGIFANIYSDVSEEEEISATASQFTLTKLILGKHFPMIMFVVAIIVIVILYGKSRTGT